MAKTEIILGEAGGKAEIATVLRPSSVSASSTHSSTYSTDNAINMNFAANGWLPTSSSTSANITFTFSSAQDIKYILFGLTAGTYGTTLNSGNMSVDIAYSNNGSYSSLTTDTFNRSGTGFIYKIYPINKNTNSIKISLESASGASSLTSGSGYKFLAFG